MCHVHLSGHLRYLTKKGKKDKHASFRFRINLLKNACVCEYRKSNRKCAVTSVRDCISSSGTTVCTLASEIDVSPWGKGADRVPLSGELTCSALPSDAGARVLPFIVLLVERACKGRSYTIPFNEATPSPGLWVVSEGAREKAPSLSMFCGMMADVAAGLVAARPCARAPNV